MWGRMELNPDPGVSGRVCSDQRREENEGKTDRNVYATAVSHLWLNKAADAALLTRRFHHHHPTIKVKFSFLKQLVRPLF